MWSISRSLYHTLEMFEYTKYHKKQKDKVATQKTNNVSSYGNTDLVFHRE